MSHGRQYPIDNLDPHLTLEPDFVLLLDNGNCYLLPNVGRIVKVKYVHKSVKITGDLNSKYMSIDADKFEKLPKIGSYNYGRMYAILNIFMLTNCHNVMASF